MVSVGRLDLNTEGLLLLTNDGGLARVLELPATGWLRRYRVRAHGRVTQQAARRAARAASPSTACATARSRPALDREQGANVWLTFAIREGKNREVRNVLEHLGLEVNRLIRVSFGPFQLGELPEGAVEEVRTRHLREQLGERIAREAEADFRADSLSRSESHRRPQRRAPLAAKRRRRTALAATERKRGRRTTEPREATRRQLRGSECSPRDPRPSTKRAARGRSKKRKR